MNAKLAKKLRRIALGTIVAAEDNGAPPVPKDGYITDRKGTVKVLPRSFKGSYKDLKKAV